MTDQHNAMITSNDRPVKGDEIVTRPHASYSTEEILLASDPICQARDILNDGAAVFSIDNEDPLEASLENMKLADIFPSREEALFAIEGYNEFIDLCERDVFFFQTSDGQTSFAGCDEIDTIRLEDADGGKIPMGWIYTVTSGSVVTLADNSVTLSENSEGFIELADGSRLDFRAIVRIEW